MKVHNRCLRCLILLHLCVLCFSCGKAKKEEPDFSSYKQYDFQPISAANILSYTIQANGTFLVCTSDGNLASYDNTGKNITEKNNDGTNYECLCFDGETLYAYDKNQSAIVDLTDAPPKTIHDSLRFYTIRNMVALDGKIYILAILQTEENENVAISFGLQDFEDYGQAVYCIDTENGEYEELPLEHIIAEYRSESGNLYFYGWQEEQYYLYEYSPKKGKVISKRNYSSMENLLAMAVEGNRLFGMTPSGLIWINLETGEKETLSETLYTPSGSLMQFSEGNLFLYDLRSGAILQAAFLGQAGNPILLARETGAAENPTGNPPLPKRTETITISQPFANIIKPLEIKSFSGLSTKAVNQPSDHESLVTELMAGNEKVDLYIFSTAYGNTRIIREMEYYVPLNDSEQIKAYLDQCFDVCKEAATAKNGDIWMLPFTASVMTTWYVPENMEQFHLTEENLNTVSHYLDTLEHLHGKLGNYRFYNYTSRFIDYCDWQYDMLYNDPENNIIDFQTDIYQNLMEPLWTGWVRYSGYGEHPLFFNDYQEPSGQAPPEGYLNDRSRVIFKTDWLDMVHPLSKEGALEGWRVMAAPKTNDPSEKQAAGIFYAIVNPYSKQKEAAIAYLEAIAANPLCTVTDPTFFLKNKEAYAKQYDITQPAFDDLLRISENLRTFFGYTLNSSYIDYITPYQEGKISIEQALEQRQRMAEMSLGE